MSPYEQHIIESKLQQHVGEDQNSDLFLTKMKNNPAADICRIWVFAKICVESGFQRHLVGTWKFIAEFDILLYENKSDLKRAAIIVKIIEK